MFGQSLARRAALCTASVATLAIAAPAAAQQPRTPAPSAPARAPIDYGTAKLERQLEVVRASGQDHARRRARRARVERGARWHTASSRTIRGRASRPPSTPRCASSTTTTPSISACSRKTISLSRLVVNDLKKDFNTGSSDGFRIILDTFHDERNAYEFATNPAGAKWDAQMTNEGRENNANWDGIWDVKTRVGETGWYAEFRIPVPHAEVHRGRHADVGRQLRAEGPAAQRRQLLVAASAHLRHRARVACGHRRRDARAAAGQESSGSSRTRRAARARVAARPTDGSFDAGLDVKYGVTSGLVWDFTVNTDFSQAEADEQQINLSRFNLFFPEKRDFFLENSGIFQFGGGGRNDGGNNGGGGPNPNAQNTANLFFSRRIGLSDNGEPIPILGGTRLSGRQGAYSIGVLNMQQRALGATQATNFTAMRLRRDILANSDIGAVLLNKEEGGPSFNRVGGVDANFRFRIPESRRLAWPRAFSPAGRAPRRRECLRVQRWIQLQHADVAGPDRLQEHRRGVQRRNGIRPAQRRQQPRRQVRATWSGRRSCRSGFARCNPHLELDVFTRQSDGASRLAIPGLSLGPELSGRLERGSRTQHEHGEHRRAVHHQQQSRRYACSRATTISTRYFIFWNTNSAARLSFNNRVGIGKFYDGYRRSFTFGPSVRLNENFNASFNLQINDISISTGSFVSKLLTTRVNYNFNTKMFVNALVQYNTRQSPVDVQHPVQHHPPSAERLLPRLQRTPRRAHRPHAEPRGDCEDDLYGRVLMT